MYPPKHLANSDLISCCHAQIIWHLATQCQIMIQQSTHSPNIPLKSDVFTCLHSIFLKILQIQIRFPAATLRLSDTQYLATSVSDWQLPTQQHSMSCSRISTSQIVIPQSLEGRNQIRFPPSTVFNTQNFIAAYSVRLTATKFIRCLLLISVRFWYFNLQSDRWTPKTSHSQIDNPDIPHQMSGICIFSPLCIFK